MSARSRSIVLWLSAALTACSARERTVRLEAPPLQPGATGVLVALEGERVLGAQVLEATDESLVELTIRGGAESVDVLGLEYPASRAMLAIPPGALVLGLNRALPSPALVHRALVTPDLPAPWERVVEVPNAITKLRLAQTEEGACALAFSPRIVDHPLPGSPKDGFAMIAAPLSDGSALIVQRGGLAYRARLDGAVLERSLSSTTAKYLGAAQEPDGTIWLNRDGVLLRGDPTRGFSEISTFSPPLQFRMWLAPRMRAGRVEVLTLTDLGSIDRFDGQTWAHIGDVPVTVVEDARETGATIAWVGDTNQAVLNTPTFYPCDERASILFCGVPPNDLGKVWILEGDRLEAMPQLASQPEGTWVTPSGRILAATAQGVISELVDKRWVEAINLGQRLSAIYETPHGLLFGLTRTQVGLLNPFVGLCTQPLRSLGGVRYIRDIEGGVILAKQRDFLTQKDGDQFSVLIWSSPPG